MPAGEIAGAILLLALAERRSGSTPEGELPKPDPEGASMSLYELKPGVNTVLNDTAETATPPGLPNGSVVRSVQPVITTAGASVPRGRIFVVVKAVQRATPTETIAVLWRGYVSTPAVKASLPNLPLPEGTGIVVQATQTGRGTSVHVAALVVVDVSADARVVGAGYVHDETPGDGPGEATVVSIANPAAGASPGDQTIAAKTHTRVRAFHATLTTDANAANRVMSFLASDAANSVSRQPIGLTPMVASRSYQVSGALGAQHCDMEGSATRARAGALPDMRLTPTDRWRLDFLDLQAGDQVAGIKVALEEWAVP